LSSLAQPGSVASICCRLRLDSRAGAGEMAALDFGPEDRPYDVIFLHANGFNALTYRSILGPLAAGLRVLAIDQRGHGESRLAAKPEGRRSWKDFRDDLRALIAAPALERVKPVVDASHPLVEGLLVRNGARRAVVLMNWAYRAGGALAPHANLSVFVRGVSSTKVESAALDRALPAEAVEGGIRVALPVLEEGDVLLLVD